MSEGAQSSDNKLSKISQQLFKPASWQVKIDFIHHLILLNNLMMLVLSERQGGKSSFLSLLRQNLDNTICSEVISLYPGFTADELNAEIQNVFYLDKAEDLQSIVDQVNQNQTHMLLMIDNAQFLDKDWINGALKVLKEQGNGGYFHICLAADYSIISTLDEMSKKDLKDLIHTIELGPLNQNETKTYVLHRAQQENISDNVFSNRLFHKIHQVSGGDLSQINEHMKHYIDRYRKKTNKKNQWLKYYATGGVAVLLLALSIQFWQSSLKKPLLTSTSQIAAINTNQMTQFSSDRGNQKNGLIEKQLASNTYIAPVPRMHNKQQTELYSHLPQMPSMEMESSIATAEIPTIKTNNSYTIQLIATHNKNTLNHLMKRYSELTNASMHRVFSKNQYWYVLTIGEFDDTKQAKNRVKQFPEHLTKLKPWIRPVKGLKSLG